MLGTGATSHDEAEAVCAANLGGYLAKIADSVELGSVKEFLEEEGPVDSHVHIGNDAGAGDYLKTHYDNDQSEFHWMDMSSAM